MRLPDYLTIRKDMMKAAATYDAGRRIKFDITIDWPKIIEQWSLAMSQAARYLRGLTTTLSSIAQAFTTAANDEVRVSGLEGRYYVTGGLACRNEADLYELIHALMYEPAAVAPREDRLLMTFLTRKSRARLAASAIRGYVYHVDKRKPS